MDVVRSMLALGFSQEEVYEVLSLAGVGWEDAQLLIERLKEEAAKFASREDRLLKAVNRITDRRHSEMMERLSAVEEKLDLALRLLRRRKASRIK